jgi:hypothetical protein
VSGSFAGREASGIETQALTVIRETMSNESERHLRLDKASSLRQAVAGTSQTDKRQVACLH